MGTTSAVPLLRLRRMVVLHLLHRVLRGVASVLVEVIMEDVEEWAQERMGLAVASEEEVVLEAEAILGKALSLTENGVEESRYQTVLEEEEDEDLVGALGVVEGADGERRKQMIPLQGLGGCLHEDFRARRRMALHIKAISRHERNMDRFSPFILSAQLALLKSRAHPSPSDNT